MVALLLVSALAAMAQDTLVLKTGSPQGSYRILGTAIKEIVESEVPGLTLRLELSSGSIENIRSLESGAADLAIVQNDIAFFAASGEGAFKGERAGSARALLGLHPEDVLVIARRDLGLPGVSAILPGHRVVIGEAGSGTMANARDVLEALGLPFSQLDTIMRSTRTSLGMLATDSADVMFLTAGVSSEFLSEIESNGGVLLSVAEDLIDVLVATHPYYSRSVLEVGGASVRTLSIRSLLVAREGVDTETVRRITAALYDNIARLRSSHPRAAEIFPGSLLQGVPIELHRGARQALCRAGLVSCGRDLSILVFVLVFIGVAFASLGVSAYARRVLIALAPQRARRLVGPHGVTDRYRFLLIPVIVGVMLLGGAHVIQKAEATYSRENNVESDFDDIGLNDNLVWMIVFTASGFEDGRFPNSPVGKLTSALMGAAGIGGLLLIVGLMTSEQIARKMRKSLKMDPSSLRDHTIVCGWNQRAPGLIRSLVDKELHSRRQTVVLVAEVGGDPIRDHGFDEDYVFHVHAAPTSLAALKTAGLEGADSVVVLADEAVPWGERDPRSLMVLIQVEKHTYHLTQPGDGKAPVRNREIHTIVETCDPESRSAMQKAFANQIICQLDFDQKLLVQSVLNPGLGNLMDEILTVDEDNEVIEVPVSGSEREHQFEGLTFDEALLVGREFGALLIAINREGAPKFGGGLGPRNTATEDDGQEEKLRHLLTNPFRVDEIGYQIRKGDSLLFFAQDEKGLQKVFGDPRLWKEAFHGRSAAAAGD